MRGVGYWIVQYLVAAVSLFAILTVVDLLSGKKFGDNLGMSAALALGMSAVFVASRYSRSRKR
ncbi:MAG: hypothetical protein ABIT83_10325 [Massilia sp.]